MAIKLHTAIVPGLFGAVKTIFLLFILLILPWVQYHTYLRGSPLGDVTVGFILIVPPAVTEEIPCMVILGSVPLLVGITFTCMVSELTPPLLSLTVIIMTIVLTVVIIVGVVTVVDVPEGFDTAPSVAYHS
jgi:hypothetical protein